jgi:hypothetical protein
MTTTATTGLTLRELVEQWLPGVRAQYADTSTMIQKKVPRRSLVLLRMTLQAELDRVRMECLQVIATIQEKSAVHLPPNNDTLAYPQEIRHEHLLPHCTLYLSPPWDVDMGFTLICSDKAAILDAALGRKYYHA